MQMNIHSFSNEITEGVFRHGDNVEHKIESNYHHSNLP